MSDDPLASYFATRAPAKKSDAPTTPAVVAKPEPVAVAVKAPAPVQKPAPVAQGAGLVNLSQEKKAVQQEEAKAAAVAPSWNTDVRYSGTKGSKNSYPKLGDSGEKKPKVKQKPAPKVNSNPYAALQKRK